MKTAKQTLKLLSVLGIIFLFCIVSLGYSLFIFNQWKLTSLRSKTLSLFCRWGLYFMGVKLRVSQGVKLKTSENRLFVSNHLSYLDILVIASQVPTCFVTSQEIKQTPFLGHLCRIASCLFVDRRTRKNLALEIKEITDALANDINVTIFPEATSTNGEQVLRFKQPLYSAAITSKKNIQPLCLNYKKIDGKNLNIENRDQIYWYDKMPFFSHLWKLLSLEQINVELNYLETLSTDTNIETKYYSEKSHQLVSERFIPCQI